MHPRSEHPRKPSQRPTRGARLLGALQPGRADADGSKDVNINDEVVDTFC